MNPNLIFNLCLSRFPLSENYRKTQKSRKTNYWKQRSFEQNFRRMSNDTLEFPLTVKFGKH